MKRLLKNIWGGYEYLFYKFCAWNLYASRGKEKYPEWTSCITLAGINWIYFLIFLAVLQRITGYGFNLLAYLTKLQMVLVSSVFVGLNYFLFIRNNKLKELVKKYGHESRKERIYGNIYACSVIVFSIILLFLSASLLKPSDFAAWSQ